LSPKIFIPGAFIQRGNLWCVKGRERFSQVLVQGKSAQESGRLANKGATVRHGKGVFLF
jgi:hypothetical protein